MTPEIIKIHSDQLVLCVNAIITFQFVFQVCFSCRINEFVYSQPSQAQPNQPELSVPGVCDLANRYEGGPGGECQEHKQVWLAP